MGQCMDILIKTGGIDHASLPEDVQVALRAHEQAKGLEGNKAQEFLARRSSDIMGLSLFFAMLVCIAIAVGAVVFLIRSLVAPPHMCVVVGIDLAIIVSVLTLCCSCCSCLGFLACFP